ncbi:alcohol dehydrogenase [Xylaria longipes]|nr:alcohol dehydrogenase [Xylaria longipes]
MSSILPCARLLRSIYIAARVHGQHRYSSISLHHKASTQKRDTRSSSNLYNTTKDTPSDTPINTMSAEIPTEQWAQVLEKTGGKVERKRIPVPKPGPDEVLINIKYSGVCHTDLHAVKGDWPLPTKLPLVGGHEGAGIVVARGELVKDVEIGDYAGIKWLNGSCMSCAFCRTSDEPLCPEPSLSGYTVDGSFQQYAIGKAAHVARIPKDCDLEAIAPVLCAGLTVYKGLKESGARPGEFVAIVGAGGGLGSMALQYARAMGLHAIAIDGGAEKEKVCLELGASTYIDFTTSKNLVEDVKKATPEGYGPHAVLLLAVSEKPFQQASEYVRSRGTIVCVGLPANAYLKAPVFDTVTRMINIKGSYVGNRQDTAEAIEFFREGLIKAPYKVVGLSQLQEVFDLMEQGKIAGRYVVDTSK